MAVDLVVVDEPPDWVPRMILRVAAGLLLATSTAMWAQNLVIEGDDFQSWDHPRGLVNVLPHGVQVKRFGKTFNAVANAGEFSSSIIGQHGVRPVRAPSNQAQADLVADQNVETRWQPDPADPTQQWWVDVDLGRAVVADKIRVIFPDTVGARPFRFFTVHTSPGIRVFGTDDALVFNQLGRPVNNNRSRIVEFDLQTTNVPLATGDHLDPGSTLDFEFVRFVRFRAEGRTPDAALAEIEVDGVGFNLSTRVAIDARAEAGEPHWGGRTWSSKSRDCVGCGKSSSADPLLDQDLAFRTWAIQATDAGNWRDSGHWGVVDFGSRYRVDRIVWLPVVYTNARIRYGFERYARSHWHELDLLTSDGTPDSQADPEVEGPFLYHMLSSIDNHCCDRGVFDFQFPTRDMRLLLWRQRSVYRGTADVLQIFAFHAEGYPAAVELESPDISLGGARTIRRVEWDAELPQGTRIEVETQTGDGFQSPGTSSRMAKR